MAGQKNHADRTGMQQQGRKRTQISAYSSRHNYRAYFLDMYFHNTVTVSLLQLLWAHNFSRNPILFGRGLIVEKNLLWYNLCMGKNRRSTEFRNSSRVIDMEEARKKRQEKRQAEREKEERKAKRALKEQSRGKTAIRKKRNRRRVIIAAVVVLIFTVIGFYVYNIVSLKMEQQDVENQRTELEAEKKQLEKQLKDVKDKENLEEQARSQLRLIKPGESLYLFDDYLTNDKNTTEEEGNSED